jgi:molybdenum cofactor cytidylyltransferase
MTEIAAIVLAAGASRRYAAAGGAEASKLLAPLIGKALVRHVVDAALASSARPIVVVTGHAREAIAAALTDAPVRLVDNPGFASGLASSLRAGVAALPPEIDGALILLADMPTVRSTLLERLIAAFAENPEASAVAPVSGGRRGNPVLLSRRLFAAIEYLSGDEGARGLLADAPSGAIIEVADEAPDSLLDIDTPDALARARGAMQP